MTLIVIAVEPDKQEITCISDSRVSNGESILSDATAKVIPFTAVVTYSINQPKKERMEWREDLCFCYAGSTLLANSVFALGANVCRNIYTSKVTSRPSLSVVAEFFRFAFEEVGRDLNSRSSLIGQSDQFAFQAEIAIFGYDRTVNCARAFILRQKTLDGKYSVVLSEYPENEVFAALGEKNAFRAVMNEQLLRLRNSGQKISVLEAFKSIHANENICGVGGGLQVCFVNREGVEVPVTLDREDMSLKIFGIPCDSKTNYDSEYTIGDISAGATIHSY